MSENDSYKNSSNTGGANNGGQGFSAANGKSLPLSGGFPTGHSEQPDVIKLIEELEDMLDNAVRMPILNTVSRFDINQFEDVLLKLRATLPDEVKKATKVVRDTDKMRSEARLAAEEEIRRSNEEAARISTEAKTKAEQLVSQATAEAAATMNEAQTQSAAMIEDARTQCNRMIDNARDQAAQMVSNTEIHKAASLQAQEIIKTSETNANEIRKGADDYARDVLYNLEGVLGKAINTVQSGREMLESAR